MLRCVILRLRYAQRRTIAVHGTYGYRVFSANASQKHGRHEPRILGNKWVLRLRFAAQSSAQHDILKFIGNKYLCRYV